MCLAIPSKVLKIDENNIAEVDTLGVKREVSLDLILISMIRYIFSFSRL